MVINMINKKRGMTLLEVIIAMAISTIILGVVTTMFVSNSSILHQVDMNSELQLQAQLVEQKLNKVAMSSTGAKLTDTNEALILFDSANLSDEHVFKQVEDELHYVMTEASDDQLIEQASVLARHVKSFEFNVDTGGNALSYTVIFEMTQGKEKETYTLKNKVVFRNN